MVACGACGGVTAMASPFELRRATLDGELSKLARGAVSRARQLLQAVGHLTLLAAQLRGRADRIGRAVPVLVIGAVLLAVGTPLTAWAFGDADVMPIVLGVGVATLFGAVGISSAESARSPYPAPRPGDAAFQQPELIGSTGALAQVGSLLLSILRRGCPAAASRRSTRLLRRSRTSS